MTEPLSLLYDAVAKELVEFSPVAAIVKKHNFLLWGEDRVVRKQTLSEGDVPELELVMTSLAPAIGATSCSSDLDVGFQLVALGAERNITDKFLPLMFSLYALSYHFQYSAFSSLTWRGETFVRAIEVPQLEVGVADGTRGVHGWSALWAINFTLGFPHSNIRGFIDG